MSDVERRLREFPSEFPRPDERTTRRVRTRLPSVTRPRRPRRPNVALAAAAVIAALAGAASVAATRYGPTQSSDPTIFGRIFKGPEVNGSQPTFLELSGRIPSGESGQLVQVLDRSCPLTAFRVMTEVRTQAGGFWQLPPMGLPGSVTYVARWNGRLSDELVYRISIFPLAMPLRNRRFRIQVGTRQQEMLGRTVVLQRRTRAGTWVAVRRAKLRHGTLYGLFHATFVVRQRGLTLRGFVPASSARPCHDAEATQPFRS